MTKVKTLSQQICELCGMKSRKICCSYDGTCDNCYSSNEIKLQQKERNYIGDFAFCKYDTAWQQEKCRNFRLKKEVYPDFENPENFVKLLELKTGDLNPRIGVLIHNAYFLGTDFTRVECLKILIKILCYPANQGSQVLDELKQSIRDYDGWVWG